jgi:NTP pyrophosphatase (non-canonical NTP hydrolase)
MEPDLQKLMNDIQGWSDATFGENQRSLPITHHLQDEVDELLEELEKRDVDGIQTEIVDCFMLLVDCASHEHMTAEELIILSHAKLIVNKRRQWGSPDEHGVIHHLDDFKESK